MRNYISQWRRKQTNASSSTLKIKKNTIWQVVDMSVLLCCPSDLWAWITYSKNNCCCYCFGPWVVFYKLCSRFLQNAPALHLLPLIDCPHLLIFTYSCCERSKPASQRSLSFSTALRPEYTLRKHLKLRACWLKVCIGSHGRHLRLAGMVNTSVPSRIVGFKRLKTLAAMWSCKYTKLPFAAILLIMCFTYTHKLASY